jgi:hypothetical protein
MTDGHPPFLPFLLERPGAKCPVDRSTHGVAPDKSSSSGVRCDRQYSIRQSIIAAPGPAVRPSRSGLLGLGRRAALGFGSGSDRPG